ncbi:MAG: HAD family phosphatase [Actinomycetota bacterium]|nr:HAD family phosphatase [Actinomycetota bacterium]
MVYTDLDGTMVGPGGSFFRTESRELTIEPAKALLALHAAGATLVLVSGRTRPQLEETARIFGADGYVGELGAILGWDRGRRHEILRGAMPDQYATSSPMQVLRSLGVVEDLFARWPGRLDWHSPWHEEHESNAMLRGRIDVAEVDEWLHGRGLGWLRLRDNGVLPVPDATHVYHLIPDGLSKGLGVARDLGRRALQREDAIAIGDSASDLDMAPYVSRMWVVGNGARQPHMADLIAAHDNVEVCADSLGLGWAEAVRAALAG